MKKDALLDAAVFVILLIATSSFPWLVAGTPFNNPALWMFIIALPIAAFLGFRKKKNWRKLIAGSLVFGVLFGVILEFIAHITLAWQVPNTIFPFRILGASTFEALIGYMPMTLLVLIFYEHFFDEDINHKISPHIWFAIIPAILAMLLITFIYLTDPSRLIFSHPYLKMGVAAIIPMVWQIVKHPPPTIQIYKTLGISLLRIFYFRNSRSNFQLLDFPGQ